MSLWTRLIRFACLAPAAVLFASPFAVAAPVHDPKLLDRARVISEVSDKKEFYVDFPAGSAPFHDLQVLLVVREVEDPLRKGWFELQFVGRAAVVETSVNRAHFVLYKPFTGGELKAGDRILQTGDPLTADEMDLLRREVLGLLHRDKELEDLYTGRISVKLGLYHGSLASHSDINGQTADTNNYKNSNSYFLENFGFRWWFFFEPSLGLNFEYASGSIPTVGFEHEAEMSTQTYLNPGLVYRSRFFFIPAIYSLTYGINKFATTNPDDFLISSTYSGVNVGVTFYYPYRIQIFRLGPFTFAFNNLEAGIAYAPSVQVSDVNYVRGTTVSGNELSYNAGVEFNLAIRGLRFTDDLFFVLEGGQQSYNLSFSGPTQGTLPDGSLIPQGVHSTEVQTWYGVRLKYNFKDYLGELIYGL